MNDILRGPKMQSIFDCQKKENNKIVETETELRQMLSQIKIDLLKKPHFIAITSKTIRVST